ncbi:hypothetical protein [Lacipirellula sp.]|uniref:hypothetical protein n=1 Tax=Lacipirellula sp. TaxID=2691419 RepID=UPI003D11E903
MSPHRRQPSSSPAPRRARVGRTARTSRSRPARRARLLTRRAKLNAARDRRGVLLLVVLSLLVLFMMVGTAFIITAKQSEKTAKTAMKASVRLASETAQTQLLDEVLLQVLRDTNNPHSSLRYHSLLGDLYGNNGLKGVVLPTPTMLNPGPAPATAIPPKFAGSTGGVDQTATGGQIIELQIGTQATGVTAPGELLRDLYGNTYQPAVGTNPPAALSFANIDNAYNGQVLTFLSGAARGRSTRIVGFIPPNTFRVMNFTLEDGTLVANPTTQLASARVLINGRPFSGTGVGLNVWADPTGPKLNAAEELVTGSGTFWPMALMPNAQFQMATAKINLPGTPPTSAGVTATDPHNAFYNPLDPVNPLGQQNWIGRGGANESYDAVDYQNMPLAYVPAPRTGGALQETMILDPTLLTNTALPVPTDLGTMIIPSWHRPELLNFFAYQTPYKNGVDIRESNLAGDAMLLRRILMRPNWLDHPNFTGSNPELAAIPNTNNIVEWQQKLTRMVYGPWDVDNDNDGIRDSVWVDVGLPVMAGPNGKLVKPLAAILIVDMDGRLNVNAHGTCDLAEAWPANGSNTGLTAMTAMTRFVNAVTLTQSDIAPHGVGYGPAEISLSDAIGFDDFRRILVGNTINGVFVPGRYGFEADMNPTGPPSGSRAIRPGMTNQSEALAQINFYGWPQKATDLSSFVTPPDLRARYAVGLNQLGQAESESTLAPVINSADTTDNLSVDSPYELNLSNKTAAGVQGVNGGYASSDAPFAVGELERVLRMFDADAGSLPSRLALLSGVATDPGDRLKLTTDSFDLPAPNISLPHEMEGLLTPDLKFRRQPNSVAELMEVRVRAALFPGNNSKLFPVPLTDVNDVNRVRAIVRRILAPELASGTRLNINRPFGNGRDDTVPRDINNPYLTPGYGVVDEPGEYVDANINGRVDLGEETQMWAVGGVRPAAADTFSSATFPLFATEILPDSAQPNGQVGVVDHRHLMARHLYTLAMMLTAEPDFGTRVPTVQDQEFARQLAQWAVNVVDFRDPDNIMTPFEYDVNPFDGWHVDGFVGAAPGPDGILGTADDVASLDGDGVRASQLELPPNMPGGTSILGPEYRGLVWGVERPEVVMSETLAWHDRRTDDTALEDVYTGNGQFEGTVNASVFDPVDPKADKDFDQLVRPRGTLFVELYNPWAADPAANADTHQRVFNNNAANRDKVHDFGVNLGAYVPDSSDPTNILKQSSVWRMAFCKRTVGKQVTQEADAYKWDPEHPDQNFRPYRQPQVQYDRTIYLGGAPGRDSLQGAAYFNDRTQNPTPAVRPGRYLVVGSGKETSTGSGIYETPIADRKGARNTNNVKAQRRIELVTSRATGTALSNRVRMLDCITDPVAAKLTDTTRQYDLQSPADDGMQVPRIPGEMLLDLAQRPVQSMSDVAIVDQVLSPGQNSPEYRRLSLTEPARGYPRKIGDATWNTSKEEYQAQGAPRALDVPLDGPIGGQAALDNQNIDWPYAYPLDEVLTEIRDPNPQTASNPRGDQGAFYGSLYLQRLANPLLPWNPEPGHPDHQNNKPINPYLTVDSMAPNVSVFNSRGSANGKEEPSADQPGGADANNPRNYFSSVQRGYTAKTQRQADANYVSSLWARETPSVVRTRPGKAGLDMLTTPRSDYRLMQLNRTDDNWFNAIPMASLGFLNTSLQDTATNGVQKQIIPSQNKAFEWLTWNNRPFVSGNEVMLTPKLRSSQLTTQFSSAETPPANWNEYQLPTSPEPDPQAGAQMVQPFRHLHGFFYQEGAAAPPPGTPLHLYRVLEYVHTPSLFVGAETWMNPSPDRFGMTLTMPLATRMETDPRISFRPPFNLIPEFREPGRVNINTLPGRDVWTGLFHGSTKSGKPSQGGQVAPVRVHPGPDDDYFASSRRGYGAATAAATLLDPTVPTMFANPFRAPDAGNLVPLPQLVRTGVDVGLLRSDKLTTAGPATDATPLFSVNSTLAYNNTDRNPYFRYQPITRLNNLVTNRSNVYAMWVTIGFFEVDEVPDWNATSGPQPVKANFNNDRELYKRVYPEGYSFGREDGVDIGNVRRIRSFYIIDRTLPAGFEPGADHNVDETVRLRRRIE